MKKILLGIILFFSFSSLGNATCLKTVTTALTDVQTCGASETLTVKSTGSIVFSGSKAVRANIERLKIEYPEGSVIIQADTLSKSGLLVETMDQIRLAGIQNISIAAKNDN